MFTDYIALQCVIIALWVSGSVCIIALRFTFVCHQLYANQLLLCVRLQEHNLCTTKTVSGITFCVCGGGSLVYNLFIPAS